MKLACGRAIARLAQMESSDLGSAYGGDVTSFGADYIITRPFDPRLLTVLAPCAAEAAMESGVAVRPIADLRAYAANLGQFIHRTGLMIKPVDHRARDDHPRVFHAEGKSDEHRAGKRDISPCRFR